MLKEQRQKLHIMIVLLCIEVFVQVGCPKWVTFTSALYVKLIYSIAHFSLTMRAFGVDNLLSVSRNANPGNSCKAYESYERHERNSYKAEFIHVSHST